MRGVSDKMHIYWIIPRKQLLRDRINYQLWPEDVFVQSDARETIGEAPVGLHINDLEVLLDLLRNPNLSEKARSVFERAIIRGLISEISVSLYSLLDAPGFN